MNGRIYDPYIGRFMSADPYIQAPYELQSHNRYSYVVNNPLLYTDPSGYAFSWGGAWHTLTGTNWVDSRATVVMVGVAALTGGWGATMMGFATTSAGYAIAAGAIGGFLGSTAGALVLGQI
jgi:hypothetical protein